LTADNLVHERLDPVVTPGYVSPHMHTVLGGSNFAATYDYDDLRNSSCTTMPVTQDFSNYWSERRNT
jgi:imidazolonepropionase-like amidohydrolase